MLDKNSSNESVSASKSKSSSSAMVVRTCVRAGCCYHVAAKKGLRMQRTVNDNKKKNSIPTIDAIMNTNVILPSKFDVSKVKFGSPKNLDNGGKMISVNYDGKQFIVQTPKMRCPYGLNKWDNEKGGPPKLSIDMSFGKYEEDAKLGSFHEMMAELNRLFIKEALDNSTAWFKKKYSSADVIEALYTSLIKVSKDKTTGEPTNVYPPTFKMSVGNNGNCEVYDGNRNRIEMDSVDLKGADLQAIIQCNGVWIAGGKFGCTWRLVQLQVFPNQTKLPRFAFKQDEEYDYDD